MEVVGLLSVVVSHSYRLVTWGKLFTHMHLSPTEQGLTSHKTHYWSYWRRFSPRSYDQTNSVKALKETSWSCR